jgi:hypothetical protein
VKATINRVAPIRRECGDAGELPPSHRAGAKRFQHANRCAQFSNAAEHAHQNRDHQPQRGDLRKKPEQPHQDLAGTGRLLGLIAVRKNGAMPKSLLMDSSIGVNLTPDGSLVTPRSSGFLWDGRARDVAGGPLGFDATMWVARTATMQRGGRSNSRVARALAVSD